MNPDIGDNQGRIGMASVNASRAAIGMKPLEEEDQPLYTPQDAADDALMFWGVIWLVIVAFLVPVTLAAIDFYDRCPR